LTDALIENPNPEPKYSGLNCGPNETCDWRDEAYSALKALVEAIPAGSQRNSALKRVESLGQKPFEEDGPSAKAWRELVAETRRSEAYPGELAKRLIGIGCAASEAPYVVGGLTEQLDARFNSHAARAEVARAFLDEENCPGAQGLSEAKKTKLRQILGPTSSRPSPGAASR